MARSSDSGRPLVLFLVTTDLSARFLKGQLADLQRHGFDVALAMNRSGRAIDIDRGVPVFDIPFVRQPRPLRDLRTLVQTIRLIRRLEPDYVNASTPKAGLIGSVASRLCRIQHRIYTVRGLRFETCTGISRALYRSMEVLSCWCATKVVFNSASLRRVAEDEGVLPRGKGIVVGNGSGNGVDCEFFPGKVGRRQAREALGLTVDERVIGFVGRMTADKGVSDLVDATAASDCHLLLVGAFEEGDPVSESIRRRIECDRSITHVGWTEDTRPMYRAMDLLAFPSYREGLPNVPLEAQLMGVPIVAYAATGTVDAMEEGVGGTFVDVGDTVGLGQEIDRWLSGENQYSPGEAQDWVRRRFERTWVWQQARKELYE